ncbi:uncharacterized protein LOC126844083 [Adelges cooleyi]|uniref:uncharacterized protein LOC126844083 n=1 Tax=Adelges cooleyi TaxID=133065 RepID=UPI00217FF147|nr:uncharacterized protein LOC126844083 [Adelges cooleyi]
MATNSCLLILILELVFYLTTVASSPLIDILVFRPIADEVRNEVGKLDFPNDTKVAFWKQYINVGNYSNDFIELLNTYKTFKDLPIGFNDDEIRLLTTSNTEDSLNDKVLAQLKYYRKSQEIQCAQYMILQYKLYYDRKRNTKEIAEHVYIMIAMAYKGNFIVFKWLWELHIALWSPAKGDQVQQLHMRGQNLEKFRKPLADLIEMCMGHKYLTVIDNGQQIPGRTVSRPSLLNKFEGCFIFKVKKHTNFKHKKPVSKELIKPPYWFNKIEEFYKLNHEKHELYKNIPALPLEFNYLTLRCVWHETSFVIKPIWNVTIDWNAIERVYTACRQKVYDQFEITHNWTKDPFKHIEFQQTFICIIRVKLYCYIWVQLAVYEPTDHTFNVNYKSLIMEMLNFSYTEDKTLNRVITLYDSLNNPNKDQIEEVLKIIIDEVNTILSNLIGCPNETELADISDLNTTSARSDFLNRIDKQFKEIGLLINESLDGLTFDVLSFFIDGSKNTHLAVFPEN